MNGRRLDPVLDPTGPGQPHFFLGGGGGGGGGFLAVEGLGETLPPIFIRFPEDLLGGGFCSFAMIDSR